MTKTKKQSDGNSSKNQEIKGRFVAREVLACFSYEMEAVGENDYQCGSCKAMFDEPENEPQEVFEWWLISGWFYEKLKAKGAVVLEWGNNHYWERCTTGHAILLDGIVTDICREMEILEGQKNEWKTN